MDPLKINAIKEWPTPVNVRGLRGFLGIAGYYRRFIKDYGKIARPLTDLLKKNAFTWSAESDIAFAALKEKLMSAPVLSLPDFEKDFVLECDASGRGIGAVLMQENKPIAYFSTILKGRGLTLSTYEKELMALVVAVKHWRHYLLGRMFTVRTDHKSLKYLWEQ